MDVGAFHVRCANVRWRVAEVGQLHTGGLASVAALVAAKQHGGAAADGSGDLGDVVARANERA